AVVDHADVLRQDDDDLVLCVLGLLVVLVRGERSRRGERDGEGERKHETVLLHHGFPEQAAGPRDFVSACLLPPSGRRLPWERSEARRRTARAIRPSRMTNSRRTKDRDTPG